MTKEDNVQARKLYDRFTRADGFVRYQIRQRINRAGVVLLALESLGHDRKNRGRSLDITSQIAAIEFRALLGFREQRGCRGPMPTRAKTALHHR